MSVSRISVPATYHHRLEYNAAKLRIDQALETLKRELKSMRDQDVALLKQLIKINETIRKLSRGRSNGPANQNKAYHPRPVIPSTAENGKARLVRQLSEPHDCRIIQRDDDAVGSSVGSLEDAVGSTDDFSFSSGSELEDSTSSLREIQMTSRPISRPRSISFMASSAKKDFDSPTTNNSVYEEILRRNIILWKHRLSSGSDGKNDSVFCEEEEDQENVHDNSVILV